ncbi:MAG: FimV/HubP family polar landmark protein [Burkholderiales bacterium]|nr:FimV/HubP family polar landmark protein [Burkholderiales bacterium]
MRTFTIGKALAVALLLLAPLLAHAAGLGRLNVQSSLGQPLSAEIDLVAVRGDEASTLNVRLASPDAYQQANLQYNAGITGLRLSIERRPNGQSFIKVTGNRPVNEPFVDLLIELSWSGGKLVREYTALLDPPGYGQQAAAVAPVVRPAAPESRPITAPVTPAPVARTVAPASAAPRAQEYGPIARGETLGKIAASLKPEGVSLEQMLVGLYRSNPDAFIRKNMNLVKSGRILRVPDAQELAAISQGEAMQEYRTQVADWRAYSARVADTAGLAPEGGSTARGRITARVDDPAAAEGKDVVRLSKGEPGRGDKPLTGAAQTRALQEELVARNKELAEAQERIAQLEKTIKDTQKLVELKSPGMAAAQQKAEVAKSDMPAPKPEMKGAEAPPTAATQDLAAATSPADKPAVEAKPAPKPQPKPVAPPPPPPEPDMMDMVMDNLPLLGGGAAVLVLGGLGFAAMRRRRARAADDAELEQLAPTFGDSAAATVGLGAGAAVATAVEAAPTADDGDPVAEAEVYIAYGRDGQAEEILKEAMSRDSSREDVQVKLAEVYAARKDAAAFGTVAESMHALTGGTGDNWIKVAALGYALDATNPLYAAGKDVVPAIPDSATGTDLDFDLGGDGFNTPDIALDADTTVQATELGGMRGLAAAADAGVVPVEPILPDFNLDATISAKATDIAPAAPPSSEASSIDFNFELPPLDSPAPAPAAPTTPAADAGLDFKIDVGDLNINLDDPSTTATPVAEGRDSHWYDVQQKFDLAKAYQEMGDNDGAREILQEVLKEGDSEQKDQAQKLLGTLG